MAVWTLTYSGTTKTFAEWGLKDLRRSQVSQAVGGVTLTHSGAAYDGSPLFAIDALITISKDEVPWHVGPVTMVPRSGGTRSESMDYQIADPWWYLERLPFSQEIASGFTTRIALFAAVSGGATIKETAAVVIQAAVDQAVAAGAPMQVAFVGSFGVSPPIADMRDPTCGEVIRACLRWVPDATVGWKYDVTPPMMVLSTRAAAAERTIDLADKQTVNLIDITARDDLRLDRVVIAYEITATDGDETTVAYAVDQVGSGSPFRTLQATIPLSGSNTQRQSQWLEVEPISLSNTAWWQRRVPSLKDATEITISGGTKEPAEEGGGDFDFAIIDGQVPGWLDDDGDPSSGSMKVSAKATYKISGPDGRTAEYKDDPISVTLNCTNLGGGTYETITSYTPGESPPTGVAAALYAALSVLQYDGKIKVKQRECSFIARPGDVLNLTNGVTAWASARMQVQKVDENADTGETTITFGPPKHLSPQDMIEMLRTLRGKGPVNNLDERRTGKKDSGNKTKGGRGGANENGAAAAANWKKVVSKNSSGTRTLTLDADAGVKMEDSGGSSIDHQVAHTRTVYTAAAGASSSVKPNEISCLDAAGNGAVLTSAGLTITNGSKSTTYGLNTLLFQDGGNSTLINEEQVVISSSGKTNIMDATSVNISDGTSNGSLTSTQLALTSSGKSATIDPESGYRGSDSGKTAQIGPNSGVQLAESGKTTSLTAEQLDMTASGANLTMNPADGLSVVADGHTAEIGPAGVHLSDGSSGTVDIATVSGKAVSIRTTAFCAEADGVAVQKSSEVLRSVEV